MTGAEEARPALDAEQTEELRRALHGLRVAPLGRNYFGPYREVREKVDRMIEESDGGLSADALSEHMDADDLDFLDSILDNLRNFGEEGVRRQGEVPPYTTALEDVGRLEPLVELLRPHLG